MALPIVQEKRVEKIIAIAAGKGGVGKSTVAVHLAVALQERGYKVGLLDVDLYGPSVRKMLPEDRMPVQEGERIKPALCRGIKMISMAYFRKEHEASIVRAPIANGVVKNFLTNVEWGNLDYLLIDYPPGTGDIQLTLSQQVPLSGALLVTTPQEVAVMDVRKSLHMFHQLNVPILGVIENMAYYGEEKVPIFGEGGGQRLAEEAGAPFLGQIPLDPQFAKLADRGETYKCDHFNKIIDNMPPLESNQHAIQAVTHPTPDTFTIEWKDGNILHYSAETLQRSCPCAGCQEGAKIEPDVTIQELIKVGHYALRVKFSKGCSHGIYDFDLLRSCGEKK